MNLANIKTIQSKVERKDVGKCQSNLFGRASLSPFSPLLLIGDPAGEIHAKWKEGEGEPRPPVGRSPLSRGEKRQERREAIDFHPGRFFPLPP